MRRSPPQNRWRSALSGLAVIFLGACATGIQDVDPADVPRLRAEVAQRPADTDVRVELGMALFKAGEYEEARSQLQSAIDDGNRSGAAYLYLGLTNEESGAWTEARDAYDSYLSMGPTGPVREEIRKRLLLVGREILREQAQLALAQEAQLAGAQAAPRSVAVLPFSFNSNREDLEPLIYALSDMMITDFSVSNALTVLERAQIQTLLDEMALTEAGYAEPNTGARAGRLLRAEHVVQGVLTTLGDDELRADTDVLNVPRGASAGDLTESGVLEELFEIEKNLVIRTIRGPLGIELTPAEEQAILENRAENVLAFVAYGRGLRELDEGNYEGAMQEFQTAVDLDPSFQPAAAALESTADMVEATTVTTNDVTQVASLTGVTGGLGVTGPTSTLNNVSDAVNPTPTTGTLDQGTALGGGEGGVQSGEDRDPVQESQGNEGATSTPTAQIRIVIRRPGGDQ